MPQAPRRPTEAPGNAAWARAMGSPELLQALLDAIPQAAFIKDAEGRYLAANQRFLEAVGRSCTEVLGQTVHRLVPPPVADQYHQRDLELARQGGTSLAEGQVISADGALRPVLIQRTGVLDASGQPLGMVGVFAESLHEQLLSRQLKLRELSFTASLVPIGITDRHARVIEVNPAFVKAWGYDSAEDITSGLTSADLIYDQERLAEGIQGVQAHGHWAGEILAKRRDGSPFWVQLSCTLVPTHIGLENEPYAFTTFQDINDQVLAQLALQERERQYRELAESANSIILRMDREGIVTYVNPFGLGFFGYTEEELLGKSAVGTLVPEADEAGRDLRAMISDIVARPDQYAYNENQNITRDGRRVWVAWTNSTSRDAHGQPLGALSIGHDITARKQAEEQLRIYEAAINSAASAIVIANLEGIITYVNQAYLQLFNLTSPDEVVGTHVSGFFSDVSRLEEIRRAMETTGQWTGDGTVRRGDGSRGIVQVLANTVADEHGRPLASMASFLDVSQRRAAEQALAAEKERLAVTLRSLSDGVITTDTAGRVVLVNQAAEQLTGWPEVEAVGQPVETILYLRRAETTAETAHPVREVLTTGRTSRLRQDGLLQTRGGETVRLQDTAAPIHDIQGTMVGVVLVFRDISEQERLREEAYRAHKLESLGILAGGIAHDFNNLLGGLVGQLENTRRRLDPLSRAHQELLETERAALQARLLTQQLLTFASGGAPVKRVLSLRRLVTDMVNLTISGRALRCELDLPEDLLAVEADEGQLAQVISNLVLNAHQAMDTGGELRVAARNVVLAAGNLQALPAGRYVHLILNDTGPGIPPEVLDRVFDPYFTTKPQGNGLGLTIAYSIISKHGGHIAATSPPGQGAVFDLYLPASDQPPPPDPASLDSPEEDLRGTGRILVMDDDPMIRKVAGAILRHLGYEVEITTNGEEAVAQYALALESPRPFAAVLLDLTVRAGLGGRATLECLRELDGAVRALACSGYSTDPVMAAPQDFGFRGAVLKPYRTQELGAALEQVLHGEDNVTP